MHFNRRLLEKNIESLLKDNKIKQTPFKILVKPISRYYLDCTIMFFFFIMKKHLIER